MNFCHTHPYSPDLAPSDFYLFPHLEEALRGNKYDNNNAVSVMAAVEDFLEMCDEDFYRMDIVTAKLVDR